MDGHKVIAQIEVVEAARMSPRGRTIIADWLRDQADALEAEGENYAPGFVASYQLGKEALSGKVHVVGIEGRR